tara:strand:+ start:4887 stop:5438 length:552 start_codon:yes stop_codon:yes gene_type:complete
MYSKICNNIKNEKDLEKKALKDKIYTPDKIALKCFNKIKYHLNKTDILYEPFYGKGAFYNLFEDYDRHYTEIDMGLDFFKIDNDIKTDYIITNPPYSIITKILDKMFLLTNLRGFGLLVNNLTMTPERLCNIEEKGFYATDLYIFKIREWFGYQYFWFFKKLDKKPLANITYTKKAFNIKSNR